ncbi:type VII toxin-antitoxin system MntA family adenylyltransferase antitoxin [Natronobeatus ordinarius]|uniref:type VII toxin-antitoxin system MntA family adenylyltransferase antitoxin n=1 Tax=Natronobeatus ordinarius TaxID=2963433 RepID=UPI0020CD0362|nr:nucleotidyltransferase domain-containing protein [Natronobeatus ordinarius]
MADEGPTASNVQSEAIDFEGIRSVLADNDVQYAVVFGSVARGEDTATSDIDLCLRFSDDLSPRERFDRRNRIDSVVQRYTTQFVDVSDVEALPDDVALNALREGVVIYGNETMKATDEQRLTDRVRSSKDEHTRERREFIDRLAEGNV